MKKFTKSQLLLTTLLSGAVIGSSALPALAQAVDDEIVVTGTRIKKKDFTSNAPVATVDAVQFERSGIINTENLLNTLPQTVPGLTRTSNNPGNGTATVDLRGLGSNRTLVLINGRRAMVNGSNAVVDINTIAPSMIKNVEVLTGGASSVYGADAVAGVVNFILRDDFEGVEANLGYNITEKGDAETLNASLTMGANFDNGKGNAVVGLSYTDRSAVFQGDRDFSRVAFFDDGNGGLEPGGSSGVPGTSIFALGLGGFSPSFGIVFNPDGSIRPFVTSGQVNDFYNYAPVNFLQLPQQRYAITSSANYEINDNAEIYLEGRFAQNNVPQELAPTPAFVTSTFTLDGNPFIDPAAQQILSGAIGLGVDTDGDGIDDEARALIRRRLVEVGPRQGQDRRNTFQLVTGVRGDITSNLEYDASVSIGRTQNASNQNGNIDTPRFLQSLLLARDANGNVILDANGNPSCADPSNNGSTVGCSPLNIFGAGNISAEAAEFIRTAVATTDETTQNIAQINFVGDFGEVSISGSPIGYAIGAEYIENKFEFNPSQNVASSSIRGFNGAPPVKGEYDVYSAYGEMHIPLIEGQAFAENIALDLAGRISNFSTAGTKYNYKVGGEWSINDRIRLRGNYNTSVRAPNIGELFSPIGENFPGADDPCSASGATGPGGTVPAAVAAICQATGVPVGVIGTSAIDPAAGQVRSLSGGNPNLDVEEAQTYTIGAVISPAGTLDGMTLSVDYYNINIDGFIAQFGGGTDNILSTCYTNPTLGGVGSLFCNAINRRPDGTIDFVSNISANVAGNKLEGVDVAISYNFDEVNIGGIDLGQLSINYLGTYNIKNEFQAFVGDRLLDCAGLFGNNCGEPDPTYRHFVTANLSRGALSTNLTWQRIGSVDDGGILDTPVTTQSVDRIGSKNYFNVSATYDFSDSVALTFGVQNLLDQKPPVIGDNDEQANTYPSSYDVFGRAFFANAKLRF